MHDSVEPPAHGRLEFALQLEVFVGGGEYNIAYALSRLGLKTRWIGKLPRNPLGRLIMNHGRAVGVDYDLNFCSKLWSSEKAQEITRSLANYMDVVIGNEEDFQKVLGFKVEGVDETLLSLPVDKYKGMVERVLETFSHLKGVGTTLREVVSGLINNWSAILCYGGEFYQSRRYENLEIEDRVGGGDGFASGTIYGFLNGMSPQKCVLFGAAHGAMLQSTRGDTSMITPDEILHVVGGGTARIKR